MDDALHTLLVIIQNDLAAIKNRGNTYAIKLGPTYPLAHMVIASMVKRAELAIEEIQQYINANEGETTE